MALPSTAHLLLLLLLLPFPSHQAQDPRLIDRIIRDSAFLSYPKHQKTAVLYNVRLPQNLSGIASDTVRFRAGSLRRHGALIKEFRFFPGVIVHPHMRRLIVVRQNLGNYSSIYYDNISGFQLASPVLGLLIYDAASIGKNSSNYLSELEIFVTKKPITVDFSGVVKQSEGRNSLCAFFDLDGKVSLSNQTDRNVCVAWRQGHFAIVIESGGGRGKVRGNGWKVVVASVVAGVLGAALLGLVVVAVVRVKKRRNQMAEMERRAYEEEALQISMVGHVRAPTASVARTTPALENDYEPSL